MSVMTTENPVVKKDPKTRALRVAVMLGGTSAEREVSLKSGASVASAIRSLGHEVVEVDPQDENWILPEETDVVFLALHGAYGEDGSVQRRLEELGVPYTGCGPEASALAFDKTETKRNFVKCGVPTPRFETLVSAGAGWPSGWNPPVILKPVRQGSSVGLQIVEQLEEWSPALGESLRFDSEVLLEELIRGRELTVGIIGGEPLPIVEICPREGTFDYHNKYTAGATEYFCPAKIDDALTERIQALALSAFEAVGGRDYGRVDLMLRSDGMPFFLEVNTLPGMTETSLLPKAAKAAGVNYEDLCQRMIDLALERKRN